MVIRMCDNSFFNNLSNELRVVYLILCRGMHSRMDDTGRIMSYVVYPARLNKLFLFGNALYLRITSTWQGRCVEMQTCFIASLLQIFFKPD